MPVAAHEWAAFDGDDDAADVVESVEEEIHEDAVAAFDEAKELVSGLEANVSDATRSAYEDASAELDRIEGAQSCLVPVALDLALIIAISDPLRGSTRGSISATRTPRSDSRPATRATPDARRSVTGSASSRRLRSSSAATPTSAWPRSPTSSAASTAAPVQRPVP